MPFKLEKKNFLYIGIGLIILSFIFFVFNASKDNKFRFVVLGCMHAGACDFQDYETAVEKIKKHNPDFVLFLGSTVDVVPRIDNKLDTILAFKKGLKLSEKDIEARWKIFDKITKQLKVPVYDLASERSLPANNLGPAEKQFLKRYKKRFYSFKFKNNLFICLDSESHNSPDLKNRGLIDGEQLEFLKKALKSSSRYNNVFIAMHQSAWNPRFTSFIRESKWYEVVHPLINGKVKYVFGACLHFLEQIKIDDVHYITSGSAPCWPDKEKANAFPHFLIVDVDNDNISIKVEPLYPIPLEALFKDEYVPIPSEQIGSVRELTNEERISFYRPEEVINSINIKPDVKVLDLGAGTGLFSFLFAEKLNSKGVVYATEIEQEKIDYLNTQIKQKGIKNIIPVLVNPTGLDPFYKKHTFDILFLCAVYEVIREGKDYLSQLKESMARDGRLYLIFLKLDPDFSQAEFGSFKSLIKQLVLMDKNHPIHLGLSEKTRHLLETLPDKQLISDELKSLLVKDLNSLLNDRWLYLRMRQNFLNIRKDDPVFMKALALPQSRQLGQWLIAELDKNKVFDLDTIDISEEDNRRIRRLNRIMIERTFYMHELNKLLFADIPVYQEKEKLISDFAEIGLELTNEFNILPCHYFLEFKAKQ
ncbi:MAG: methyltransferase domain-containing protein [Candidatus Omnitrophica bacterium]|nr:methyltransferase domain-containing protein [Candidatus Omnitrophota bacterium]